MLVAGRVNGNVNHTAWSRYHCRPGGAVVGRLLRTAGGTSNHGAGIKGYQGVDRACGCGQLSDEPVTTVG